MARKILLADDSVTAQNMGRKILVDAGYDVLTVNNGSAALKRITEAKPDLIILDVYMPGYSGLEVCQRLKDAPETAHIPVLLSVGKLEPFKPQEARRVKANAHIVKPFEASELLSAIARLEDGMVPQAHKPSFCSPLPSSETLSDDAFPTWETKTDTGRKSGSRSGSGRKKEPATEEAVPNFRDFRKVKGKAAEAEASAAAEMPRDITKEELDALSAVAAKLDGSTPSESAAAMQIAGAPAEAALVNAQGTAANLGHMDLEVAEEVVAAAAEMRAAAEAVEMPAVAADAAPSTVAPRNEIEIPVQQVEPANEVAAAQPQVESSPLEVQAVQSQPAEGKPAEPQIMEHQPAEIQASPDETAETPVNAEAFAQEPAPVDQQDEPMFALAPPEEKVEAPAVEAEEIRVQAEPEAQKEEPEEEKAKAVEAEPDIPLPAMVTETVEAEVPAPSDQELAEALRLLTPASAYAGAVVSAQEQMNDDGRDALAGPRWVAEAVGLSPEEAAMSLEAEMFRTFATVPAGENESAPVAERVSPITAAVENRLAEVAMQGAAGSEEAPKAMAAAAAAETSTPAEKSTPGSEEIAIASIVDQVLADLRPKIVEEIAKKLGKSR